MAEHSAMGQRFQMGPESSTPGSGGTAAYTFPSLNFNLAPAGDPPLESRHAGGKEVGAVIQGDTWSAGALGGGTGNQNVMDFNEAVFLAEGNLQNSSPTGTTAITRVYEQQPDNTDTVLTYKAQRGDSSAVTTFTNVMIASLGFTFNRRQATTVTAAALGKQMALGSALDSAAGISQQPVASTNTGLYNPTSFGGTLSGHRLSPPGMSFEWHNNNKYAPYMVLDDSVIGPLGFLEGAVDHGGTASIPFDVSGSDLAGPFNMTNLKNGTPFFISVLNTGPNIPGTSTPYSLQLDLCIVLNGAPTPNIVDNVIVWNWPYRVVPDSTSGVGVRLTIVSAVPAAYTAFAV